MQCNPRLKCTAQPGKPGSNSEKLDLGSCPEPIFEFLCPREKSAFITSRCLPQTLHVPELLPSNMNSPWDQEHTQPPGHQGCTPTTRMGSNRAEPQNRGYLFRLYHQVLNKAILTFFHILNAPRIWEVHFKGGEKYLSPNFCHSKIHRKY